MNCADLVLLTASLHTVVLLSVAVMLATTELQRIPKECLAHVSLTALFCVYG